VLVGDSDASCDDGVWLYVPCEYVFRNSASMFRPTPVLEWHCDPADPHVSSSSAFSPRGGELAV